MTGPNSAVPTAPSADVAEVVRAAAAAFLPNPATFCTPLVGYGSVNRVFVVGNADARLVVRLRADAAARDEYRKERWCLRQAARSGIPSPEVLGVGQVGEIAWIAQTFVAGVNGADRTVDQRAVWRRLGEFARVVHAIPVRGWGEQLADARSGRFAAPRHPGFDGTWPGFVRYNLGCLGPADPVRAMGVLTASQSDAVAARLAALLARRFSFGLVHGDLAARNVVVDAAGAMTLLDWGSAAVHIVPHWDIVQLRMTQLDQSDPNDLHFSAFRAGYGLSDAAWHSLEDELVTLLVLRTIDTLRWALERRPAQVGRYAALAMLALRTLPDAAWSERA